MGTCWPNDWIDCHFDSSCESWRKWWWGSWSTQLALFIRSVSALSCLFLLQHFLSLLALTFPVSSFLSTACLSSTLPVSSSSLSCLLLPQHFLSLPSSSFYISSLVLSVSSFLSTSCLFLLQHFLHLPSLALPVSSFSTSCLFLSTSGLLQHLSLPSSALPVSSFFSTSCLFLSTSCLPEYLLSLPSSALPVFFPQHFPLLPSSTLCASSFLVFCSSAFLFIAATFLPSFCGLVHWALAWLEAVCSHCLFLKEKRVAQCLR